MSKYGLLGFIFSILWMQSFGQVNQKYFGHTSGSCFALRNATLKNGNRVVVGYAFPNGTSTVGADALITCIDPSDNVLWSKELGTPNIDRFLYVYPTADGGCVAAGYANTANGNTDYTAFVAKFTAGGTVSWTRLFKNTSPGEFFYWVTEVPSNGHIVCAGVYNNTAGTSKTLIVDLDATGTVLWSKTYDGNGSDGACAITTKGSDLIVTGYFQGLSYYDGYLMEVDESNGNPKWSRSFDYASTINGNTGNWPREIRIVSNKIYVDMSDFDVYNLTSAQHGLVSFDTSGQNPVCLEYRFPGSPLVDAIASYIVSPSEIYLFSAPTPALWAFETGNTVANMTEMVITKVKSMNAATPGPLVYSRKFGNPGVQFMRSAEIVNNRIIGFGATQGDVVNGIGDQDIFKLDADTSFPTTGNSCAVDVPAPTFGNPVVTLNSTYLIGAIAPVTLIIPTTTLTINPLILNTSTPCNGDVIINKYAAVLGTNKSCTNSYIVDTAAAFAIGDTILMIQMKGATIDSSNASTFGNILSYNNAGNYEYNVVQSIYGNNISLKFRVIKNYDIPNGKVQFVKIPSFAAYTANSRHTCIPWNGSKGGVFGIRVSGRLTLNANIEVSGMGFKGGQGNLTASNTPVCDRLDFYFGPNIDSGAQKGEGISILSPSKSYGRGPLANGGGGGNSSNAGGGGGSNAGLGGGGGMEIQSCNPIVHVTGGIGGDRLTYSLANNTIFMGGGGGAGHGNDKVQIDGGNGGGLIIVQAGSINGNQYSFMANGANAPECTGATANCTNDGTGGGGGGGTVLISAATVLGQPTIDANGGKGANLYLSTPMINTAHGPGGGGGGGLAYLSSGPAAAITANLRGGRSGVIPQQANSPYGATAGAYGTSLAGLTFPALIDTVIYGTISSSFNENLLSCLQYQFYFNGQGIATYQWYFGNAGSSNLQNPIFNFPAIGTYPITLVITDTNGCMYSLTKPLTILPYKGSKWDSTLCSGKSIVLTIPSGTAFSWSPGTGLSDSTTASVIARPISTTRYFITVVDGANCTFMDTVTVNVLPSVIANFTYSPNPPTLNTPIQFLSSGSNGDTYLWNFGDGTLSAETNPSHLYPKSGAFWVCLIASNKGQCPDTVCQNLYADVHIGIDVPTAFSPDNNGSNDILYARGVGVISMNLKIYNRWGLMVFESNNMSQGWDGKYKGMNQDVDVFGYVLNASFIDGTTITKKGNITLLR